MGVQEDGEVEDVDETGYVEEWEDREDAIEIWRRDFKHLEALGYDLSLLLAG